MAIPVGSLVHLAADVVKAVPGGVTVEEADKIGGDVLSVAMQIFGLTAPEGTKIPLSQLVKLVEDLIKFSKGGISSDEGHALLQDLLAVAAVVADDAQLVLGVKL